MARPGLTNHRKFRRLAKQLGSAVIARGVLELIWESCYESGDEYVGTAEDIDHLIGWTGEMGIVAAALVSAGQPEGHGFLEPVSADGAGGPLRYRVHDLWHHAPDYVTKRRKREMERRERSEPVSAERRQTAPTSDSQDGDVLPPSPSPAPSPAPAAKNVSAEPPRGTTLAASVVLEFPTVGKGLGTWALTDAQVADWQTCYPGINVESECRKALAWVRAKLDRRKTARGMAAFLVGWLNRSNDRGGRAPAGAGHAAPQPERDIWTCRHIEECSHRAMCEHKNNMPQKYPKRDETEAS
jgi:hypothetical protein